MRFYGGSQDRIAGWNSSGYSGTNLFGNSAYHMFVYSE